MANTPQDHRFLRKPVILAILVGVAVAALLILLVYREDAHAPGSESSATTPQISPSQPTISLDGREFKVKIADTPQTRAQGLSGTNSLPSDQGMLFIFQNPEKACFWMKDMHYNLDILWFDGERHLIYQQRDLAPSTYPNSFCPPLATTYVLEVNSGVAQSLGTKAGDELTIVKQ